MECDICLEKFDHSKHKPYCLTPCAHTFCVICVTSLKNKSCPSCNLKIQNWNPNWHSLKLIPESEYDKTIKELEKSFAEATDLKLKLETDSETRLSGFLTNINQHEIQIKTKADEMINSIISNRDKYLNEISNIKLNIMDLAKNLKITNQTQSTFVQVKECLETNCLNIMELTNLNDEFSKQKQELSVKFNQMSKIDEKIKLIVKQSIDFEQFISNKIYNKKPDQINHDKGYFEQGKVLFRSKNYTEAINLFNMAINKSPNISEIYLWKGDSHYFLNDNNNALQCFNKAIDLDINSDNAYFNKGKTLYRLADYDQAITCFNKAITINPLDSVIYNWKGEAYFSSNDFSNAIQCFDKATNLNPQYNNAYFNKGKTYHQLKEYQLSIQEYDKAIQFDSNNTKIYIQKGLTYIRLNDLNEAINCFDQSISLDQNCHSGYINKGIALFQLEKYKNSIELFNKSIDINAKDYQSHNWKGSALCALGQYDKAVACFDTALQLNRSDNVYYNKGRAMLYLDKHEQALECFNSAIEINPKNLLAKEKKAIILVKLNK